MTDVKEEILDVSDADLINEGLYKLSEAMAFFMEVKDHVASDVLVNISYGLTRFCEEYLDSLNEQV